MGALVRVARLAWYRDAFVGFALAVAVPVVVSFWARVVVLIHSVLLS